MRIEGAADVGCWVASNWATDITVREWWRRLADAGLGEPTWPPPFGRSWSRGDAQLVTKELAAVGAVAPPRGAIGTTLAGPTLLAHGTAEQQATYLAPLLRGEESWCQLFSEPGAGSDLPAVATTATPVDGGWRVSGQKVWSSGADVARRGLLLARTDPNAPKRDGLSYFVLDMDQPGVEVRPLRQLDGRALFCEVFLDNAFVAAGDLVGGLGEGWRVARTTLGFERAAVASRPPRGLVQVPSGEAAGALDGGVAEVLARPATRSPYSGNAVPAQDLVALARRRGRAGDPVVRQALARYHSLVELNRYTTMRQRAAAPGGRSPGAEGSITKLAVSRLCRASRNLSFTLMGADALLWGDDAPEGGSLHTVALGSLGVSIGGGTDEIQRNLLGERLLGLPVEPGPAT